jgi:hypothetical protein
VMQILRAAEFKLIRMAVLGLALNNLVGASDVAQTSSVRYAFRVPGVDIGAEINALYNSLPAGGGEIVLRESASFSTPVIFGTNDKPVLLVGLPVDIVTLSYTGAGGAALTFDYGTGHRMGHGMRDLTLTGPGDSTNTIGAIFGGVNGTEGIEFRDFKVQSFGINLQMGSNTWLAYFQHGMVRDGGINLLLPSGLVRAGEQITFNHVTFADAPPPHTNSVWVQGGGRKSFSRIAPSTRRNCEWETAESLGHRS